MSTASFDELVAAVHTSARADDDIARLEAASAISAALTDASDALLDHFVERCRQAGHSWAQIGMALGVSKQAAQQRFVDGAMSRLTPRMRHVVDVAREISADHGAADVRLDHLLLALPSQPEAIGWKVLHDAGVTEEALAAALRERTTARGAKLHEQPPADQALLATALGLGHNYIGTEHVLLACYRRPGAPVAKALDDVGAPEKAIRPAVLTALEAVR